MKLEACMYVYIMYFHISMYVNPHFNGTNDQVYFFFLNMYMITEHTFKARWSTSYACML